MTEESGYDAVELADGVVAERDFEPDAWAEPEGTAAGIEVDEVDEVDVVVIESIDEPTDDSIDPIDDPRVLAALERLADLDGLPVAEAVEVFTDVHARLNEALGASTQADADAGVLFSGEQ